MEIKNKKGKRKVEKKEKNVKGTRIRAQTALNHAQPCISTWFMPVRALYQVPTQIPKLIHFRMICLELGSLGNRGHLTRSLGTLQLGAKMETREFYFYVDVLFSFPLPSLFFYFSSSSPPTLLSPLLLPLSYCSIVLCHWVSSAILDFAAILR